ncbi:hypothetical protein G647_00252 [Cladophialophora carrionii CBS 160.54]|uniref:Required for respiratory growth protein 7, mitochondrial n=1 Tax=Cladophialophora carrionii CBS 160.54 TaxID=1279043 RepID=V9DNA6_9EURO|nr:uncharacterized protein G647_00252 [Cladophialophora carrionii CBS 160.54]ETI27803.1 hypothetical protein G647_00252 [Cladophialophora carrionii CBS 160.54]
MLLARHLWRSRHGNAFQNARTGASASASVPVKKKATPSRLVSTRWFSPSRVARSVDANDSPSRTSLHLHHPSAAPAPTASTSTAATADAAAAEVDEESRSRTPSSDRSPTLRTQLDTAARPSAHSSLHSFQAYARRTGLSPTSTVYAGTTYEYVTQATLRDYGFELYRVGGRGDRGIDLIGVWRVPGSSSLSSQEWNGRGEKKKTKNDTSPQVGAESSATEPELEPELVPQRYETPAFALKVLVQCKRLVGKHAKIGPHLIRELDGTVRAARITPLFEAMLSQDIWNTSRSKTYEHEREEADEGPAVDVDADVDVDTHIVTDNQHRHHSPMAGNLGAAGPAIGVLVSTKPATKGVVDSMRRSTRGLVWVMMEEEVPTSPEIELDDSSSSEGRGEVRPPPEQQEDSSSSEAPSPTTVLSGRVKQILWNQAARDLGLEGVDVVKRYDGEGREEVVLMRGGRVWGPG